MVPFKEELLMEYMALQAHGGELGVFTHNNIDGDNREPKGCLSKIDTNLQDRGRTIRDEIQGRIQSQDMG